MKDKILEQRYGRYGYPHRYSIAKAVGICALATTIFALVCFFASSKGDKSKQGNSNLEIKTWEVMSKYDTNRDGQLNSNELKSLLRGYKIVNQ